MEILVYVIGFIVTLFLSLGMMGGFDNKQDNPYK
jgi:hypothetical protein